MWSKEASGEMGKNRAAGRSGPTWGRLEEPHYWRDKVGGGVHGSYSRKWILEMPSWIGLILYEGRHKENWRRKPYKPTGVKRKWARSRRARMAGPYRAAHALEGSEHTSISGSSQPPHLTHCLPKVHRPRFHHLSVSIVMCLLSSKC